MQWEHEGGNPFLKGDWDREMVESEMGNNENRPMDVDVDDDTSAGVMNVAELQKELEESRSKAHEYLDGWQRARAEFANYKRRVDRDQAEVYKNAVGAAVKRYLEIIDDLERALKNRPLEGEGAAWADGIDLIYRKFLNILESEGVKPMNAHEQMFDPTLHEAITSEDSNKHESGQIIEVLQQGYLLGDKVLRPALVRVAK